MMTYDEAMQQAIRYAASGSDATASVWTRIARELREAEAGPLLGRVLEHYTVQDIEAETCLGHEQIVVRLPSSRGRWWHAHDRSWCDERRYVNPRATGWQAPAQAQIPMPVATRDLEQHDDHTQRLDDRLRVPLPDEAMTEVIGALRNCFNCGRTIGYDDSVQAWRHVTSQQVVCIMPDSTDDTAVHAWPAAT
jgi:hypothetical protein